MRVKQFYDEKSPTNKEFADFLKKEYGIGGHSGNGEISFVDHDSKGIFFTLENGEKFKFTWSEVAGMTFEIIDKNEYITQNDDIIHKESSADSDIHDNDNKINYHFSKDFSVKSGAKSKYQENIAAIKTLKILEKENRNATPEEQEILAHYVGWGGITQAFDERNEKWSKEYTELKELLTPDEYRSARASVRTAFYTESFICSEMWNMLAKNGFTGGNILEPAMGTGNMLGAMPVEI